MKRILSLVVILCSLAVAGCTKSSDSRMTLWYDYPADEFIES